MKSNQINRLTLTAFIVCMIICMLCACNKAVDTTPKASPAVTPNAQAFTPEDIGGTTPTPTVNVTFNIKKINKIETPKKNSDVAYSLPASLGSFLATTSCVVHGKVTKVTEYKMTGKTDDGEKYHDNYYFSAVEMKVIDMMSNSNEYNSQKTITFKTSRSTHEELRDMSTGLILKVPEVGDECIVFLTDISINATDYFDEMKECVDYDILCENVCLSIKSEQGYLLPNFMRLAGKENATGYYGYNEITEVVLANLDKIRGISMLQEFQERFGS